MELKTIEERGNGARLNINPVKPTHFGFDLKLNKAVGRPKTRVKKAIIPMNAAQAIGRIGVPLGMNRNG